MKNGTRLAAVDIGSNSFRLEIAQLDHGQLRRSEYLKETVRLGNGLDGARNLTHEAMQRGWDALARFGERLAGFEPAQVRAVATQTLREAHNRDEFLLRARTELGFGIDVIPGREEARLIYLGVARLLPQDESTSSERRLVIDIGGRSTELIIGRRLEALATESYRLGSVAWSMKYFPQDQFTQQAFRNAEIAAQALLDEAIGTYGSGNWDVAYGASGTIGAVGDTREGLDWLLDRLLKAGSADKLRIEGMREDRKAVIGGGVSVLRALFDLLGIRQMKVAQGALRHGALYELLDRDEGTADVRGATVEHLATRFGTDAAQAARVAETAAALFAQLGTPPERALRELRWAGRLHEIGTLIAHSDYHKHGAYILANADAPGFTTNEMQALSLLVLGHRGKLRKIDAALQDPAFVAQLLALRLAVILCHARRDPQRGAISLQSAGANGFALRCDAPWCERFPQSAHLLREEVLAWQKTPWRLSLRVA
jgi:exopolyphosphatase/guanosine-5'-triphosphate,3'-diphosphate pyrophosphatase